jgi:tetratricopeptide (TPR) repeat protein
MLRVTTLTVAALIIAVFVVSCGGTDYSAQVEQHKKVAAELTNNKLYRAAVEEYQKVLDMPGLDNSERGNICYLIGRTYYRDLSDYAAAAAYYVRANEYDPGASYANEASKNLVACLEKLGHYADARRQLDAAVDVEPGPASDSDVVVAKVGDREIWLSEVENQIDMLPQQVQEQLRDKEALRQYIHQYVGVELLYNAAKREDFLSDPDIQRQQEQLLKRLLVERYVSDKIMPRVEIDTMDVRNYYQANKDTRYNGAPFDSVRVQVFMDYQSDKTEAAYNDYIQQLAKAEQVEFFDQRVK